MYYTSTYTDVYTLVGVSSSNTGMYCTSTYSDMLEKN